MDQLAHIGIEYTDFVPRIAVLTNGTLHTIALVPDLSDQLIFLDYDPQKKLSELGVAFPTVLDNIARPELASAERLIRELLRIIFQSIKMQFGKQFGRAVFAVPMGLTSGRRAALVTNAEEAGFTDVELVDASIPSGMVYSKSVETPTTQLVYHLGYGNCEYALLRVVRGRVKVLDSSVAESVSGQLFDIQVMEAIVLALRAQNIFLGLKSFRVKQWLLFRKIAAKAREDLGKKPVVEVDLPPSLVSQAGSIRITLSAAGLAARSAPVINNTIDDMVALLERNDVKPEEIDAVIVLGDTATRPPVAALLARAFPGKVMIGNVGTIAAASATYSAWLERDSNGGEIRADLSYYLSPYQAPADSPSDPAASAGAGTPLVSAVTIQESGTPRPAAETAASGAAPAKSAAEVRVEPSPPEGGPSASARPSLSAAETAKDLIEQGRYPEAIEVLRRLTSEPESADSAAPPADLTGPQALMSQAESFLERGLYADGVGLSHRAYAEAGSDGALFARMLGVHIKAATALNQPEDYETAIRLLMCAHAHDQTNRAVHQALAGRHYDHARATHALGDDETAKEAVTQALRFDPKHQDALALFDELSGAAETKPA